MSSMTICCCGLTILVMTELVFCSSCSTGSSSCCWGSEGFLGFYFSIFLMCPLDVSMYEGRCFLIWDIFMLGQVVK